MYPNQVLPGGIDLVLRGREFAAPRVRAAAGLKGQVLEIGFGSGLNMVAAAGLELTRLDTYYMRGPRALGYTFEGVAVRP